jgi:hypothetical protein
MSGGRVMLRMMPIYSKTDELTLLKDQFDALVHDEDMREGSIETFVDGDVCRRFGEWIARAARRKTRRDGG